VIQFEPLVDETVAEYEQWKHQHTLEEVEVQVELIAYHLKHHEHCADPNEDAAHYNENFLIIALVEDETSNRTRTECARSCRFELFTNQSLPPLYVRIKRNIIEAIPGMPE
jgi:hypothetical protein